MLLKLFSALSCIGCAHDTAFVRQIIWAFRDLQAPEDVVAFIWLIITQIGQVLHFVLITLERSEVAGSFLWSVGFEPFSALLAENIKVIAPFAFLEAVETPFHPSAAALFLTMREKKIFLRAFWAFTGESSLPGRLDVSVAHSINDSIEGFLDFDVGILDGSPRVAR